MLPSRGQGAVWLRTTERLAAVSVLKQGSPFTQFACIVASFYHSSCLSGFLKACLLLCQGRPAAVLVLHGIVSVAQQYQVQQW